MLCKIWTPTEYAYENRDKEYKQACKDAKKNGLPPPPPPEDPADATAGPAPMWSGKLEADKSEPTATKPKWKSAFGLVYAGEGAAAEPRVEFHKSEKAVKKGGNTTDPDFMLWDGTVAKEGEDGKNGKFWLVTMVQADSGMKRLRIVSEEAQRLIDAATAAAAPPAAPPPPPPPEPELAAGIAAAMQAHSELAAQEEEEERKMLQSEAEMLAEMTEEDRREFLRDKVEAFYQKQPWFQEEEERTKRMTPSLGELYTGQAAEEEEEEDDDEDDDEGQELDFRPEDTLGFILIENLHPSFEKAGEPLRYLKVSRIVKHSPAGEYEQQGKLSVDAVLERIDGVSVIGRSYEEVMGLLRSQSNLSQRSMRSKHGRVHAQMRERADAMTLTFRRRVRWVEEGLFGIPLQGLLDLDGAVLPDIVTRCVEYLEEEGLCAPPDTPRRCLCCRLHRHR